MTHKLQPTTPQVLILPSFSKLGCVLLTLAVGAATASAATITWQAPSNIVSSSDVVTTGDFDRAINYNGDPQTVNGVTFAYGKNPANPFTIGNTTLSSPLTNISVSDGAGNGGDWAALASSDPSYSRILEGHVYADGGGAYTPLTLTLNGLVEGTDYLFQAWMNDSRSGSLVTREQTFTGGANTSADLAFNVPQAANGLGQFIIGTFTADSSLSQTITINGVAGDVNVAAIAAFQLRSLPVPEPGTVGLLAFSLTAILAVRRRRNA